MAYLRRHKRSPFWYLSKRNLDTGLWSEQSTGLRADNDSDTRKAQRLADKSSAEERRIGSPGSSAAFLAWVPGYSATHWRDGSSSMSRYTVAWQAIKSFLAHSDIMYPRQVKYSHGAAYVDWRLHTVVHNKYVGHNTALLELKFLSQLMGEAVRREFAERNPLIGLNIARHPPKVKPELSDNEIKKIWKAMKSQPEWMKTAFQISLHTGCRFSECSVPIENIDFKKWTIKFRDAKRKESDPRKYFTVPVEPPLRPVLQRLKWSGEKVTCTLSQDKNGRVNKVFKKAGVDASFHSLRVTFVTRHHREGVQMPEVMKLVNHAGQLVHLIYSRLNVDDLRAARSRVKLPTLE